MSSTPNVEKVAMMGKMWFREVRRSPAVFWIVVVLGAGVGVWGMTRAVASRDQSSSSEEKGASPERRDITVGVVDLTTILQRIPELRAELAALQNDVQRAQSQFQKRQSELLVFQRELQTLTPGSPEFEKHQESLKQQLGKLQTEMQLQQQQFFDRERQAYLQAFERIEKAVQEVARKKGLILILRRTRPPTASATPQELLGFVSREVIWAEDALDITEEVTKRLLGASE